MPRPSLFLRYIEMCLGRDATRFHQRHCWQSRLCRLVDEVYLGTHVDIITIKTYRAITTDIDPPCTMLVIV